MNKRIVYNMIFHLCFILSCLFFTNVVSGKSVLTMGRFSDKALKAQQQIEPIINYLASRLKDVSIERGEVVLVRDNETVLKYLRDGKLDIVLEAPFSAYLYMVKANATPILLAWRKGAGEYSSFIFVRKDSGIHRIEDLRGNVIAFEDRGSTSAYFLPKYSINAKGLDLVEVKSTDIDIPDEKIGYIFADSELNISSWVFFNKVDAGALSSTDWNDHKDNPKAYREEFEIIYETQSVPRMLVIVRDGLEERLVKRITEELLNMDKNDEGRNALKEFKVQKFYEPLEGLDSALKPIKDMLKKASVIEVQ